ncbi:sensor histidine kinase [Microbacterium oleivorans]|nr:histidine kinase [Microbacterium oleivorans]
MTPMSHTDPAITTRTSEPSVLLGTRRAAFLFALTVFLATVIQVLATPISALIEGGGAWPFPLPVPVVLGILVIGCAVQAASLAVSDRHPQVAVLTCVGVHLALVVGLQVPTWLTGMYLVVALALFLLATRRPAGIALTWLAIAGVATIGGLLAWMLSIGTLWSVAFWWTVAEVARFGAPAAAGTTLGLWWAAKVSRMRDARKEAELARRDHATRVADAQTTERARIAQELHDVAGQHLAGLITLADAALKLAPGQPERALGLVESVRDEGRFAAASLAGALSDLRSTGPMGAEAVPDLRNVSDLLEFWRDRGMTVTYNPTGDLMNLPAVVSTTAYRCLQEALTNSAKHSAGAPVGIWVTSTDENLRVTVHNEAGAESATSRGLDLGWGLRGMTERVELLQGTLSAAKPPTGGWQLQFDIPTFTTTV